MRRLIWLPVAGFLLIAGAAVATAAPGLISRAQAMLPAAAASPDPSTAPDAVHPDKEAFLNEVLTDLVAKGTITQAQADAILSGVQTKIDDRRAELQKLREQWQAVQAQIKTFLADGVITQAEIDQLPADNPLRVAFDSIAQNGQVTLDQLRQFGPFGFGRGGPGFGFGRDHRGPFNWTEPAPEVSPAPSATPGA
jgi:membrane-bound lytic murein transglycosylase B